MIAVVVVCLLTCGGAYAAETLVKQDAVGSSKISGLDAARVKSPLSLLDMSRFHMSQSYGLSYVNSGSRGQMIGMYLNQVDYDFSKSVHVTFGLGWVHQPQSMFGSANRSNTSQLLPSFQFTWQPSKKFRLSVGYERRYWPWLTQSEQRDETNCTCKGLLQRYRMID